MSGSIEERDWVAEEHVDLRRDWEPLRMRCCCCCCAACVLLREGDPALLVARLRVSSMALVSVEHRLPLLPRREHRASLRL